MARDTDITLYREYFDGDTTAIYTGFYDRFGDADINTSDRVQERETPIFNVAKRALMRRMALTPIQDAQVSVQKMGRGEDGKAEWIEDEALTQWLIDWLGGDNFGSGVNFRAFAPELLKYLELDGEAPLKIIKRDGVPVVRLLDDLYFEIHTSETNIFDVQNYTVEYEIERDTEAESDSGEEAYTYTETIDAKAYKVEKDGADIGPPDSIDHGLGFIPLVLIKREEVRGDLHGRSGMADLVEPQNNITRCMVNLSRANKYGGWGLYSATDQGGQTPDAIDLTPGGYIPVPVNRIAADGAGEPLFKELAEWQDHLYDLAGLKRATQDQVAESPNMSGKALLVLTAEGKSIVEQTMSRCASGLALLCRYALVIGGAAIDANNTATVKVAVTFPPLDADDPAQNTERSRVLFQEGYDREALRVMGYEESEIETLMAEREMDKNEAPEFDGSANIAG